MDGRYTDCERLRWNVLRYNCTSSHERFFSDSNSREKRRIRTDLGPVLNRRSNQLCVRPHGKHIVGQHGVGADELVVPDCRM